MKTIPLFYYPTTTIWIDDDQLFLKAMESYFRNKFSFIHTFDSAKLCLDFLKNYKSPLSNNNFLYEIKDDENYGMLQHSPTDFDITKLVNLSNDKNRHQEITSIAVDYNMPKMNGFELVKQCDFLTIKKLLLTGCAEESKAIVGFNNNLIHRFIQKGDDKMESKISSCLKEFSSDYFQRITAPLLSHLEADNKLPLSDPSFIEFFDEFCQKENIIEYYLIDKKGSFKCINEKGACLYLVVQPSKYAEKWLSSYGSELTSTEINSIKNKEILPFFGEGKEAWHFEKKDWHNHFYKITAEPIFGRDIYHWVKIIAQPE